MIKLQKIKDWSQSLLQKSQNMYVISTNMEK